MSCSFPAKGAETIRPGNSPFCFILLITMQTAKSFGRLILKSIKRAARLKSGLTQGQYTRFNSTSLGRSVIQPPLLLEVKPFRAVLTGLLSF